jgi:hemerythrin-like domain-containing protein
MESQMVTLEHEHHRFEKATEVLKHEHRVIERVLAVVQKLTEPSRQLSIEQWRKAIEFIRGFADQCHHLKEEKILFPALEKHGIPLEGGPIGMMLIEHEEGRGYVRAMADALARAEKDPEAAKKTLAENAKSYLRLLREHILKEDEILFNMADGALSLDEQKQLAIEFEEHEAREIGSGVHEKYLGIAQELEKALA